jgi:glycosyltransferase involved in cell wall biosynthesis
MSEPAADRYTVAFLPDYTHTNPYQENLAEAIDAKVSYPDTDRTLPVLRTVLADEEVVLHFHWLDHFVLSPSLLWTVIGMTSTALQLVVARLLGIPVVWTVHNVLSHDSPYPRAERAFKSAFVRVLCDGVFVHCEEAADSVLSAYGLPERLRYRISLIHHGHYLNNFEQAGSAARGRRSKTTYLYLGQIRPYKEVPRLMDAFSGLDDPDAELFVVGAPSTERLKRVVRERSDDNRITTDLRFVDDEEVEGYMSRADVVVLPYADISTSGSAVLAMSFARAVVVPRLGCVPELLDERGAVFYTAGDTEALRNALTEAKERDLDAMGQHNLDRVRQYDWESVAVTTTRVYESAL